MLTAKSGIIFVVEKEADIDNVEKSGFKGLYFVLGGTVPLAAEEPEKYIRLPESSCAASSAMEQTETQRNYPRPLGHHRGRPHAPDPPREAPPHAEAMQFKISSLGRGLSTGSELEYADPDTIASALNSRQ
jgi:recombinational DNA repair protein RecR